MDNGFREATYGFGEAMKGSDEAENRQDDAVNELKGMLQEGVAARYCAWCH